MVGKPLWVAGVVAVVALGGMLLWGFSSTVEYETTAIERARIVQEVSASGNVEPLEELDLHFQGSGRLIARPVRAGAAVAAGDVLAEQDEAALRAQLAEMQAGVDVQRARLAQLLAGSSPEQVRLAETSAAGARDALAKAVRSAYTAADSAVYAKSDVVFIDPRALSPKLRFNANDLYVFQKPETQRRVIEDLWRDWTAEVATLDGGDPSAAATSAQRNLREVALLLDYIAQALNSDTQGFDVETLALWRASVAAARSEVNTAAAQLTAAIEAHERAAASLALATAEARPEDIALAEAQIRQAQAAMQRIQAQLEDTRIIAPVAGTVTRTRGDVGEIVGADIAVVSLMPDGGLQVRLNVSEGNIVNVTTGQRARITLDAFPQGAEWSGTVLEIEPAETVIGGAVYYEVVVAFDAADPRVRRGMSANVWIQTAENPQALVVPASAITAREGKSYVRVLAGREPEEREVQIGIASSDGKVEVVSGLSESELVVLGEKP